MMTGMMATKDSDALDIGKGSSSSRGPSRFRYDSIASARSDTAIPTVMICIALATGIPPPELRSLTCLPSESLYKSILGL